MNAPSQSLAHVKELEDRYVMSTFARNNVEFVQGSGMELTDSTGKTYLDFLALALPYAALATTTPF